MTVLEVGPSRVRRLSPGGDPRLDGEMVSQALAGIDETTVLIDERPVTVDSLWRHIISSSIEERSQPVTILHPSWWSPRRVARILDAASSVAAEVVATPRAALISGQHCGDVVTVVEFAEDVVAVCTGGGSTCRLSGWDDAASIAADITADRVLIDAPHGVHGAQELGATLRKALLRIGLFAEIARIEEQVVPSTTEIAAAEPMQQSWFPAQMVAATVVGIVVCGVGLATARPSATVWAVRAESAAFVEGRVSLRIPAGWTVTRVTAGPGSRRVEISSPTDHAAALHLTQSYTREQTLEDAALMLRRALAKEPAGTFVDFRPADERAGRGAVTYREVRAGRDVRWSVVIDGATRIGIGCQSAPGDENIIETACEEAIRSAHEVGGTPKPP